MCGRVATVRFPSKLLASLGVQVPQSYTFTPSYNKSPGSSILTVLQEDPHHLHESHWGYNDIINARSETVYEKTMWSPLMDRGRCLVIVDGYFEWRIISEKKPKQPYFIHAADRQSLTLAGLYSWINKKNPPNIVLLTKPAVSTLGYIHHRMPVAMGKIEREMWLAKDSSREALRFFLGVQHPLEHTLWNAYPINTTVNNPNNQGSDILRPLKAAS